MSVGALDLLVGTHRRCVGFLRPGVPANHTFARFTAIIASIAESASIAYVTIENPHPHKGGVPTIFT